MLCSPVHSGCLGRGEAGLSVLRSAGVLFWSLTPAQHLTPGQIATKQSPCSRPPTAGLSAPAPEGYSSSRVKTGRTGSLIQLPGLEPPFSFFQLPRKLGVELCKWARSVEGARAPLCHSFLGLSRAQCWVSEEKHSRGRGCPRKELVPKGVPKIV